MRSADQPSALDEEIERRYDMLADRTVERAALERIAACPPLRLVDFSKVRRAHYLAAVDLARLLHLKRAFERSGVPYD